MLAATPRPRLAFIWEPFSLLSRPGMRVDLRHWFTYVTPENEEAIRAALTDILAFRYHARAELRSIRSAKDAGRMGRDWVRMWSWSRQHAVPLMKDPIALFSAEWLADTFGMEVVVTIRHPAAFAASLMRFGWRHPFSHFTEQPALMTELEAYAADIERYAAMEQPLFDQAVLLWLVIHDRIRAYQVRRSWAFVRHEDLAVRPVEGFRALYGRLGLEWSDAVEARIEEHSRPGNPVVSSDSASLRRDSAASIRVWRQHLSVEQIDVIRRRTEPVASTWYGDSDW
jgi:hypothetical protein